MESIVKKLRGNLTQMELSKLTGMAQSTLAEYELGRTPKPEILDRIAAAVGKKVEWVITDKKEIEERKLTIPLKRREAADGIGYLSERQQKGNKKKYLGREGDYMQFTKQTRETEL